MFEFDAEITLQCRHPNSRNQEALFCLWLVNQKMIFWAIASSPPNAHPDRSVTQTTRKNKSAHSGKDGHKLIIPIQLSLHFFNAHIQMSSRSPTRINHQAVSESVKTIQVIRILLKYKSHQKCANKFIVLFNTPKGGFF